MKACLEEKGASHLEQVCSHAENMDALAKHFRTEIKNLIRSYRTCQTSRQVCDIREMYLDAEDAALRSHIKKVYGLYREARRDLQAMRRAMKREAGL